MRPVDAMDLYLVRHATSTRASTDIWGRLVDAPLEQGFEAQLSSTRSALETIPEMIVFSSPLARCLQTAQFVCPGRRIHILDEFRAYQSGIFEEATEASIRERHPEYLSLSYRERFLQPRFGEESIAEQAKRVATGLPTVLRQGGKEPVVVAHYSTINIIAHISMLNWDQSEYANGVYDLEEGGFIRITIDPAAVEIGLERHLQANW